MVFISLFAGRGQPCGQSDKLHRSPVRGSVAADRRPDYHEVLEALQQAVDEVRLRITNNVYLA
jgi:hypothetical protein